MTEQSTSNNHSFQDESVWLGRLIKKIARSERMDDQKAESYAEELNGYYASGHYNLYSATYSWMHRDAADEADMEYLIINFDQIIKAYKRRYPEDLDGLERVTKLADYVLLERARSGVQSTLELKVKRGLDESSDKLERLETLRKDIEESRKESSSQTITVLSIFTGIAMAFFGGFSLLGSAFDNLSYGLPSVAAISLIVGLILFNTIFVFLYVASKISGSPISRCGSQDCVSCSVKEDCPDKEVWHKRIFKRYQLICVINATFIVLLIASVAIYFLADGIKVENNNASSDSETSQSEPSHEGDTSSSVTFDITEINPESQIAASSIPSAQVPAEQE